MTRRFATRTTHDFPLVSENEKGERVIEKVSVAYRSYSQKLIDEIEAAETTETKRTIPYSAYLAHQVARIFVPGKDGAADEDLTGDDGKLIMFYDGQSPESLKGAREFFDALSVDITQPLFQAIEDDISPQKASPGPGQDGSPVSQA